MRKGPHKMMLESSRYDKWGGAGGGGPPGGGGGPPGGTWAGRERERDRERERQARAHQMSSALQQEPDASTLFPAPFRVTDNKDRVSQQIQSKLGDYLLAQSLLDDPSKSIGICAEPASPAPSHPSRRESEFKRPSHAPQNGRVHHRPYHSNKNEVAGSTTTLQPHRPPPLRIPNGFQHQNSIDSSQPPIESILKEMRSLPTPLSVIAATPRKELDNKFIFNPYTNKVQENPHLSSNDLKAPLTKPGLDNRLAESRSPVSPDLVQKDLGICSEDETAASTTRLHPILSPIGSGGSPSSGSESTASDSESESSSTESVSNTAPPPPPPPPERPSWSLSNFGFPSLANPAQQAQQTYDSEKELAHALADGKEKPSPISELSDTEASSPSPGSVERRRKRSPASDDDSTPHDRSSSPRQSGSSSSGGKRGRPPKPPPPKKKRGRPPKHRPSEEPVLPPAPAPAPPSALENKTHILCKVFTPRKGDEGGGKGGKGGKGKGGKGKGGKGKGQVTIIEATGPDDLERRRDRDELAARLSPPVPAAPPAPLSPPPRVARPPASPLSPPPRSARPPAPAPRPASPRLPPDRARHDRLPSDRLQTIDRLQAERLSNERLQAERLSYDRILSEKADKLQVDRLPSKLSIERLERDRMERISAERVSERYVKAEADVGSGVKSERGSERIPDPITSVRVGALGGGSGRGGGVVVRIPLARLRRDLLRALPAPRRPPRAPAPAPAAPAAPPAPAPPIRVESVPTAVTPEAVVEGRAGSLGRETEGEGEGQTPIYYSYFERLPPDALSDEERDHKYYLAEARRLRAAAEREAGAVPRVMLYLESVLCFVLTGRVLELQLDAARAFTVYRDTIEYIKSIHALPQRYRASPHCAFTKLDILSLRVQSLLYLRMFKMYNREVKEYYKIVQEYQQKPASADPVSPLCASPAGSLGTPGGAGTGAGGGLAHAVPAAAHHALLQLTKYYTFLYVAHELWEQADCLCRLRPNQDLFIAVDRKCGPLTLFSTFRHLVQYVRYAISLLKNAPRE